MGGEVLKYSAPSGGGGGTVNCQLEKPAGASTMAKSRRTPGDLLELTPYGAEHCRCAPR